MQDPLPLSGKGNMLLAFSGKKPTQSAVKGQVAAKVVKPGKFRRTKTVESAGQIAEYKNWLAHPDWRAPQMSQLHGLLHTVFRRILNTGMGSKKPTIELKFLKLFEPNALSETQAHELCDLSFAVVSRIRHEITNAIESNRNNLIELLTPFAHVFGKELILDRLQRHTPCQVTHGVQHYLLSQRQGPPLDEIEVASYNMLHFNPITYNKLEDEVFNQSQPPGSTVLSRNVKRVLGNLHKMNRLGETLRQTGLPDVVALQEVGDIDFIKSFLKTQGLENVYPNILHYPSTTGEHNLAILTTNRVLPKNPNRVLTKNSPRPVGEVTLDLGNGKTLTVFNMHLKNSFKNDPSTWSNSEVRNEEATSIGARIQKLKAQNPKANFVVIGDANEPDHSLAEPLGLREIPLPEGKSTHKRGHLDHVYISDTLSTEGITVVGDLKAKPAPPSDHLPMKLKLHIQN